MANVTYYSQHHSPPDSKQAIAVWADLPQLSRKLLLQRLSQLLERQLEQHLAHHQEVSNERDDAE